MTDHPRAIGECATIHGLLVVTAHVTSRRATPAPRADFTAGRGQQCQDVG
jgi:hypothetical protein